LPPGSEVTYPVRNPAAGAVRPISLNVLKAPPCTAMAKGSVPKKENTAPFQKELPVSPRILATWCLIPKLVGYLEFYFLARMQNTPNEADLETEARIDEFCVRGELSSKMAEIAAMVRNGGGIRQTVYKLRSKEGKNTNYVVDFVKAYLEKITDAKIDSYRTCRLISKTSPGECACTFPGPSEKYKKEVEDMRSILSLLKNVQGEEPYKKTLAMITPLVISTGRTKDILRTASLVTGAQGTQSLGIGRHLMEYAHYFYAKGIHYEAYRIIDSVSRSGDITKSGDRMRLMVMARYFLEKDCLRMYCCAIERAKVLGMDVDLRVARAYLRYLKHQRVIRDYDYLIGHRAGHQKSDVMIGARRGEEEDRREIATEEEIPQSILEGTSLKRWQWYEENIGKSIPLDSEGIVDMVSFLRKNKLRYVLEEGFLRVGEGSVPMPFTSYIRELEPRKEKEAGPLPYAEEASVENRERREEKGEEKKEEETGEEKREIGKKLFEEREFLLRLSLEKGREESLGESCEERGENTLWIVNDRFRAAKEEEIDMVDRISESYDKVLLLVEEFSEKMRLKAKARLAEEAPHSPEATPEKTTQYRSPRAEEAVRMEWRRAPLSPQEGGARSASIPERTGGIYSTGRFLSPERKGVGSPEREDAEKSVSMPSLVERPRWRGRESFGEGGAYEPKIRASAAEYSPKPRGEKKEEEAPEKKLVWKKK
jgi:hypothetical protein